MHFKDLQGFSWVREFSMLLRVKQRLNSRPLAARAPRLPSLPPRTPRGIEAAMHMTSETILTRLAGPPPAMLRAGCAALLVSLSACGGGDDGTPPRSATPEPAPPSAGSKSSVDGGASGNPIDLRVALSANGDGFVVWRADASPRQELWVNRYSAATGAWGEPVSMESSSGHVGDDFDLTVDANGNAVVAWTRLRDFSTVLMSARFDHGVGAWATPDVIADISNQYGPRLAGDATGAAQVVWGSGVGRFLDPASGIWQPPALFAQMTVTSGFSFAPMVALDGSGNALALFHYGRTGLELLASNYFSRSTGNWDQLPPDTGWEAVIGQVPGSMVFDFGYFPVVQLVASANGNFLAAWQQSFGMDVYDSTIRIASFKSAIRMWSWAQIVVPNNELDDVRFQRPGSNACGNALLLSARKRRRRPGAARVDPGRGRRETREGRAASTRRLDASVVRRCQHFPITLSATLIGSRVLPCLYPKPPDTKP